MQFYRLHNRYEQNGKKRSQISFVLVFFIPTKSWTMPLIFLIILYLTKPNYDDVTTTKIGKVDKCAAMIKVTQNLLICQQLLNTIENLSRIGKVI